MKPRARIFIVDDHPTVRLGLRFVLAGESDLMICGEAEDQAEALTGVRRAQPDLAIVDLHLKNSSGLELIKDLRAQHARMPVLVFSVEEGAEMALRSLRAGASGFVSKAESPATLLTAIRAVLAGQRYLPSSLAGLVTSRLLDAGNGVEDRSLTDRESEVFEMLAVGCSTGQIAAALHVSVKTVETYYDRLKQKYSVHTSRELLAVAARCHRCPGCPFEGRANRTALAARAPYRGNVW